MPMLPLCSACQSRTQLACGEVQPSLLDLSSSTSLCLPPLCPQQAKLRLEMEMERLRQTHAKEVENREEEVEEIRQSCQKKVRLWEEAGASIVQTLPEDQSEAASSCLFGMPQSLALAGAPKKPLVCVWGSAKLQYHGGGEGWEATGVNFR